MIFSKSHFWAFLFASTIFMVSCQKGDEKASTLFETGVFIVNQGPSGSGTGTVSYYDRDADIIKNDIYGSANGGAAIGATLQSMSLYSGKAYLIANSANKLVSVNSKTFLLSSSLATGLIAPRYFLPIDATRAYITQWGSDSTNSGIVIYDYTSNTIASTIPTGKGADRIVRNTTTGTVWVLNSKDSTVAIVNSGGDSILQKVTVGIAPNSVAQDANGDMWVLCDGNPSKNASQLVFVRNNAIAFTFDVPKGASSLIADKSRSTLYFLANNQIYIKDLYNFDANTPSVLLKPTGATALSALGFDARTGLLWCGDALDGKQSGVVHIIDPVTKVETKMLTVGVVPKWFIFQ